MTQPLESAPAQQKSLPAATPRSRAILFTLLRLAGSALILVILFQFLPLAQVGNALRLMPAQLWLGVLAGYLLAHTVAVGKWRMMVNLAGAGLSFPQAARCYFAGLSSTLILPSIVGGDVVRAGLAFRLGRSRAAVLLGGLLDRMLDVASLAILTGMGALLVPGALSPASRRVFFGAGAMVIVLGAGTAILLALLPARRFSFHIRRKLVHVRRAGRSMARQPQYVLASLTLAVIVQGAFLLLTVRIAEECGLHLPLRAWFFAWPLAKLAALVPLTQGGIGVREAALAALLAPFGARAVLAVAVGLAWEAIVISGGLIAGLASFLLGRLATK